MITPQLITTVLVLNLLLPLSPGWVRVLHPSVAGAHSFASDKLQEEDLSSALKRLNAEISANPDDVSLLLRRAAVYTSLGNYGQGVKDVNRAVKLNPDSPMTLARAAEIVLVQDVDSAMKYVNKAIEIDREFVPALAVRASILTMTGDREGATRDVDHVLSRDPDNTMMNGLKGMILLTSRNLNRS